MRKANDIDSNELDPATRKRLDDESWWPEPETVHWVIGTSQSPEPDIPETEEGE